MWLGSFSFSVWPSWARACVQAMTAKLHLCYCSSGSTIPNGMPFGWLLLADTQTFSPLLQAPASANTLPCTAFRGSVAGCFSVLTNMFGQTVFGPYRHLLVRSLWSCRAEFFGQKGLVKSGTRQSEEQSVAGLFTLHSLTSSRHDGASAVCEAEEGALLILISIVTYVRLRVLQSVDAGCTSCVRRNNLSYSVTINSCQERPRGVTVGNRRGGEFSLMLV